MNVDDYLVETYGPNHKVLFGFFEIVMFKEGWEAATRQVLALYDDPDILEEDVRNQVEKQLLTSS